MKLRLIKYCAALCLCALIICNRSNGQLAGKIWCESTKDFVVDFGMCYLGDSLQATFYLKNTGSQKLQIISFDPSYYCGVFQSDHPIDFNEFDDVIGSPPAVIKPDSTLRLVMQYYARGGNDTNTYKPGLKIALLKLGLFDEQITSPPNYSDLVASDSFKLIARKTSHFIDGYDHLVQFDSTYIFPASKNSYSWLVKNVWNDSLDIDSEKYTQLSPQLTSPEFEIKGYPLPLRLYSKNILPWTISYYPQNAGEDSALYELAFRPLPLSKPDSIDFAWVKMKGIGVVQDLSIQSSNCSFSNDTIDAGEIWVGNSKDITAFVVNDGNMPFGPTSHYLYRESSMDIVEDFQLRDSVYLSDRHLLVAETDSFKIRFTPRTRGVQIARYEIGSDIASRGIIGVPPSALQKNIYIKATGIEPFISVQSDTIDFGNITTYSDCPTSKTFTLDINNSGNAALLIREINIAPPFSASPANTTVPPFSTGKISLVFDSNVLGDFSSTMQLITNARPPQDTFNLVLIASSVPPAEFNLKIPTNLKSRPGTRISVPIIVDKNVIVRASNFSDTLIYNPSLLKFSDYSNIETASQGAEYSSIQFTEGEGTLGISISMPASTYFFASDTLICLYFDTFLGDKISSPISFSKPRFGDDICSNVLTPTAYDGLFRLDSVCGLPLKLMPYTTNKMRLEVPQPNPAVDYAELEYEIVSSFYVRIFIVNSFGEQVLQPVCEFLPAGTYRLPMDLSAVPSGIYYCIMQAGLFSRTQKIIITR